MSAPVPGTAVLRCNQWTPLDVRFDSRVSVEPNSGCWLWVGVCTVSKSGDMRPKINRNGRPITAYRYSYERFVGPIPDGKMICHKCNVSICVNPDHLYAGTRSDNTKDSVRAGTHVFVKYNAIMQAKSRAAVAAKRARQAIASATGEA